MSSSTASPGLRHGRPPGRKRCPAWQRVLAAGVLVAAATAGCHRERTPRPNVWVTGARQALERAVKDARSTKDDYWAVLQLSNAAEVMARVDRNAALQIVDEAVRRAESIPELSRVLTGAHTMQGGPVRGQGRIDALEMVGTHAARIDRKRGLELLEQAVELAQEALPVAGFDRSAVMATAASDIADIEPQAAIPLVSRIPEASSRARVLTAAAVAFARTEPARAEKTLRQAIRALVDAGEPSQADAALAQVAAELARRYQKRSAALLKTVKRADDRDYVLLELVRASAKHDPEKAGEYARQVQDPIGRTTAFRVLAKAQLDNMSRYLRSAVDGIKAGLNQRHWKDPIGLAAETALVALSLDDSGQRNQGLSLVNAAARQARVKCSDDQSRRSALIILSAAGARLEPTVARNLLHEALQGLTDEAITYRYGGFQLVAPPLAVLQPELAELCLQLAPDDRQRALLLFDMAYFAAGARPDAARSWLRRASKLSKSVYAGDEIILEARAPAEGALVRRPDDALQTVRSFALPRYRMVAYVSLAQAFLDRPPARCTPEYAVKFLALSLRRVRFD